MARHPRPPEEALETVRLEWRRARRLLVDFHETIAMLQNLLRHEREVNALTMRELAECRKEHAKRLESLRKVHARELANAVKVASSR